jgi:hypothetical protein
MQSKDSIEKPQSGAGSDSFVGCFAALNMTTQGVRVPHVPSRFWTDVG